ncbi:hypothetical protein Taro_023989 [Colocasia esculenta]|uniref:AB hydrolase-1 domain-containing protein n=1 Tax=Colocasia esculenta TaxID=4460 RepID=A0A843VA03_COLES|nr:hypothetical protein [Colocasia esculenta]
MAAGKRKLETLRRALRTVFFMVSLVVSLLVVSAPVIVAMGDVTMSMVLVSWFACARCYGVKEHLERYDFRSSLMDIPLLSVVRSLMITCVYSLCDGPGISHGPYLGTVTLCSLGSLIILSAKAFVFAPVLEMESEDTSPLVLAYKNVFSGLAKSPRSPTPLKGRALKSDSEAKRKGMITDEGDLPISLLADIDSLFVACQGIILHYKISVVETLHSFSLTSSPFPESNLNCSPPPLSPGKLIYNRSLAVSSRMQNHIRRSFSSNFQTSSLYAPLLADSAISPTFSFDEIPSLSLDDTICDICLPKCASLEVGDIQGGKFGVVLVHGFGGGVFSWRHIMDSLARQVGCAVVAFDRPGWGLSSRPHRKDWEDRQLANPYGLESQVDLLLSFCSVMEFSSVVLVGHDDGGLLALKAAGKARTFKSSTVEVKGVVLLNVSISRELVPSFARILLHTSLGQKHMVRPLLRAEITQVIYRHAWYDAIKLTTDVMNLYKRLVAISGCGHLPHEECPEALLGALSPFISKLLSSTETLQEQPHSRTPTSQAAHESLKTRLRKKGFLFGDFSPVSLPPSELRLFSSPQLPPSSRRAQRRGPLAAAAAAARVGGSCPSRGRGGLFLSSFPFFSPTFFFFLFYTLQGGLAQRRPSARRPPWLTALLKAGEAGI